MMFVLECVFVEFIVKIVEMLSILVIGIGVGVKVDG